MKVAIGNDHAGTEYKNTIVEFLKTKGMRSLILVRILMKA